MQIFWVMALVGLIVFMGWPWWSLFALFWLVPKLGRVSCGNWFWARDEEAPWQRSDKPKRRADDFPGYPTHQMPRPAVDSSARRRIIRTSDGEFMVAVEDPATGMLVLEENNTNGS